MTRYDEIKKRVQGTTSSQNSPAAGNRQSSYEDIKASFHPSYEEIKANPANYDDSDPGKAQRVLGWKAEHDLAAMCRDSWRWQSQNPKGYDA